MTAIKKIVSTLKHAYFSLGFQNKPPSTIQKKIDNYLHRLLLKLRGIQYRAPLQNAGIGTTQEYAANSCRMHLVPSQNSLPRILILKSDHIGDFIVSIPAILAIKTAWPNGKIDIICSATVRSIAHKLSIFHDIYEFDLFPPSEKIGTEDIDRSKSEKFLPPQGRYDIAIDFRHSGETLAILKNVNADFKAAFLSSTPAPWLDIGIPNMEWRADSITPSPLPAKDRLMLLSQAVISFFTPLTIPWLREHTIERHTLQIGIGLGAGSVARKWGVSNYATLINQLVEEYIEPTIVLFGGPAELAEANDILSFINNTINIKNYVGGRQLSDVGDLLAELDLFVGSDTGLTHFASALSVPTIDIFGGVGNIDIWHLSGPRAITIQTPRPCSPCYIRTANQCIMAQPCVQTIDPFQVFADCKRLLSPVTLGQTNGFKKIIKSIYQYTGIQYCPPSTLLGRINYFAIAMWQFISSFLTNSPKQKTSRYEFGLDLHIESNNDLKKYTPGPSELNILILKLDHIGDFVTAAPAFTLLRQLWPNANLHLVCQPYLVGLANHLNLFSKITPYRFFPASHEIGGILPSPPPLPEAITADHYEFAIDLRHDYDTRALLSYINADYRIGFLGKTRNPINLDICLPSMEWNRINSPQFPPPAHAKDRLLLLVHRLAYHFTSASFPTDLRAPMLGNGMYIGIGVGAGAPTRQWSIENFSTLIENLHKRFNAAIILYGGENDTSFSQAILNNLNGSIDITNYTGQLSLEQLPFSFQSLSLYIGHDSGLTHLASALNIPTVAVYPGCGNYPVWRPAGENTTILHVSPFCSPCNIRNIKDCKFNMMCFEPITVDEVFRACARSLTASHHE